MKRLTRDWFRKEVVSVEFQAEMEYDRTEHTATCETLLSHLLARCYGNQTDVFCNNRYLTTFFRS